MPEYIEREALISRLQKVCVTDDIFGMGMQCGIEHAINCTKEASAADVVEVVHGEWIKKGMITRCSNCDSRALYNNHQDLVLSAICPHCGAKMDGERRRRMTENKSSALTDAEIIKGLEHCSEYRCIAECPKYYDTTDADICRSHLIREALDLITRQKAEIEFKRKRIFHDTELITSLRNAIKILETKLNMAKTEAIKEFADRLKNGVDSLPYKWLGISETVLHTIIDNLVKEMVGDNNAEIQS